jgi:hypothetical protein
MKRWMIIALSVAALAFLAYNAVRKKASRALDDRRWYVSRLHYKFSGTVDSVRRIGTQKGFIIFHTTDSVDKTIENFLNQKPNIKGRMRLLMFRPAGKMTIFSPAGGKAEVGDSLYIDSDADKIYLFRKTEKITETDISKYLTGSPF